MKAIQLRDLRYRFPEARGDVLSGIDWELDRGEYCLLTGDSGAGKTTLLRCLNGLIPHFHGGYFGGSAHILGHDTRQNGPRDLARQVGMVFQDPESQLVTEAVEDEIVFLLENLGTPPVEIRSRLESVLDALEIQHLRNRTTPTLSGGERQRVAIAAALIAEPDLLVLDEPTSQLDPLSAASVLQTVATLHNQLGITVVLAEHRLERVLPHATQLAAIAPGEFQSGPVSEMLPHLDAAPPLARLALHVGWSDVLLTVEEFRRRVGTSFANDNDPANYALEGDRNVGRWHPELVEGSLLQARDHVNRKRDPSHPEGTRLRSAQDASLIAPGAPLVEVHGLTFSYGDEPVLHDIEFTAHEGEVIALIGRNGSGKTTLLKHLNGLLRPERGEILVDGQSITGKPVWEIARTVGYVPQHPGSILHQETLADELRFTLNAQDRHGDIADTLSQFDIERYAKQNPLDLSGGERQRAAIAAFAVAQPRVLILDEPTRGLPAAEKARLGRFARDYASRGNCVILATHDPEFVASCADRVIQLESGRVVADGTPVEVLAGSPVYATQINRMFGGLALTIDDVIAASGVLR